MRLPWVFRRSIVRRWSWRVRPLLGIRMRFVARSARGFCRPSWRLLRLPCEFKLCCLIACFSPTCTISAVVLGELYKIVQWGVIGQLCLEARAFFTDFDCVLHSFNQ